MSRQKLHSHERFAIGLSLVLCVAINLIAPTWGYEDHHFGRRGIDSEWYKENHHLSRPEECARVCRKGAPPKTCYYQFTLELYATVGAACQICTPNATNTGKCQCVLADGFERGFLSINRQLPGPSIRVCEGDSIVVDVNNQMQGMESAIHWHGVFQRGTPYYDGVPMVTQCASLQGDIFRYQFGTKDNAGTHWYHSHTGLQKEDGVIGSLVVVQPQSEDPNGYLYDHDFADHVIIISDWMHEYSIERFPGRVHNNTGQRPDNLLINGKGQFTDPQTGLTTNSSLATFTISSREKFRFRMINAFCTVCPAQLTIQGHSLTVIASDGEPIKPVKVNSIVSFTGERYDFVIDGNQKAGAYWIQLRGLGECGGDPRIQQLGILRYYSGPSKPSSPAPTYDNGLPRGVVLNPFGGECGKQSDAICVSQLRNARKVDSGILQKVPDLKFYLPFGFFTYQPADLFKPNTYKQFFVPPGGQSEITSLVNNISHIAPPAPLISQIDDIPPKMFCNDHNRPKNCGNPCLCTHKIDIPLHSVVEIIMVDTGGQGGNLSHPFHLHGYAYNVLGTGVLPDQNVTNVPVNYYMDLDRRGLLHRNFEAPPGKDTLAVPQGGYTIFRFKADNPGYWLLHCHFLWHLVVGMNVILHVGRQADLPPIPPNFPRCGDYLPPIIRQAHIHDEY